MPKKTTARSKDLPFATKGATYVDAREPSGARKVWQAVQGGDSWQLTRWVQAPDGEWTALPDASKHETWIAALASDTDALSFPSTTPRSIVVPDPGPLLQLLSTNGAALTTADEGDAEDIDAWGDEDVYFENVIPMRATINKRTLVTAVTEGIAAAFLLRDGEVLGDEIAGFGWGGESGMTSGAGQWSLLRTSSGRAVAVPTGDAVESSNEVVVVHLDDASGVHITDWIRRIEDNVMGVYGAAALELEPLDPNGTLAEEELADWKEVIASLSSGYGETTWMSVRATPEAKAHIRERLASDTVYAQVRDALRSPAEGKWLLERLEEGDVGVLYHGRS